MEAQPNQDAKKSHRARKAGRKAEKKKEKNKHVQDLTAQQRNPKAFAFNSIVKTKRKVARSADLKSKKHHIPVVNRAPLEPPPVVVAVVGGYKVGKSTLIRSLIRNYTRQKLSTIQGPITVVAGRKHRMTLVEVKNDLNCMVDIAKVADVALLMIDITIGIEMEIFEFLEICRSYGSPKIMGILNHLDLMKTGKMMRKKKKELTHRFQVELYPGAKLFSLTGLLHGEYMKREMNNLGRYISILKFRPLQFKMTHPYVLVDRVEDITNVEKIRQDPLCKRNVVLYGYVRGIPMKLNQLVHIPGVGDYSIKDINILDDPCPLPHHLKKRSLNAKERLMYAPMSGVSGVIYDKDAIYIDLGASHLGRKNLSGEERESSKNIMSSLLQLKKTVNEKTADSSFKLFSHSKPVNIIEEMEEEEEDADEEEEEDDTASIERDGERHSNPKFESVPGRDGVMRRRVVFEDEDAIGSGSDNDSEEDDGDSVEEGYVSDDGSIENEEPSEHKRHKRRKTETSWEEDENSELNEANNSRIPETEDTSQTKQNAGILNLPGISKSQAISTKNYIAYLRDSIYGDVLSKEDTSKDGESSDDEDDLFRKVKGSIGKKSSTLAAGAEIDGLDSSKFMQNSIRNWNDDETLELVRDCFVSGKWSIKEDAATLLKLDDEDHDLYGDFEDLETGLKFNGEEEKPADEEVNQNKSSTKTAQEKRLEKKRRLKEFFNSEYDEKGADDHFDALKAEMNTQAELNRKQFEGLDDETRIAYEGFRAGLYVRMEFESMDSEFITNFDSAYPIIVGGILDNERAMAFVKARMKVHRWFPRILKNKDPLYLSLGWRRFQTMLFYAKREDNFRLRSLKYARKHLYVEALFWGPVAEVSSGFVAFQDVNTRNANFSIAANGVVLETDQSTKLVKKLKLIGYPDKILQKTAFIKDMFHSDMEVVKFIGAKIKTQSSIRGLIKKAFGPNGSFRATFEDIIKMSDTVILNTWVPIEVPNFCSIVKNLLLPVNKKMEWPGMKTNAQLKKEKNIRYEPNPDSVYTEITERREYIPLPLTIPKGLQKTLPYSCKPKLKDAIKEQQRVIVVKDPEEIKMEAFMENLRAVMKDKVNQKRLEKLKRSEQHKKLIQEREAKRLMREKKKKASECKRKSVKQRKTE